MAEIDVNQLLMLFACWDSLPLVGTEKSSLTTFPLSVFGCFLGSSEFAFVVMSGSSSDSVDLSEETINFFDKIQRKRESK